RRRRPDRGRHPGGPRDRAASRGHAPAQAGRTRERSRAGAPGGTRSGAVPAGGAMSEDLTIELRHGNVRFTDRADGNMSTVAGDRAGAESQARLRDALGLDGIARGYQVHGTRVVVASSGTEGRTQEELDSA